MVWGNVRGKSPRPQLEPVGGLVPTGARELGHTSIMVSPACSASTVGLWSLCSIYPRWALPFLQTDMSGPSALRYYPRWSPWRFSFVMMGRHCPPTATRRPPRNRTTSPAAGGHRIVIAAKLFMAASHIPNECHAQSSTVSNGNKAPRRKP